MMTDLRRTEPEPTFEEVSSYFDSGREPFDERIEHSATAQLTLDALERLRGVSTDLFARDEAHTEAPDPGWMSSIVAAIGREVRSGRTIPLTSGGPSASDSHERSLGMITEAALLGSIRSAGDGIEGVLVASSSLAGDLSSAESEVDVQVVISVRYGVPLQTSADLVRGRVAEQIARHTLLRVRSIDVVVSDVHLPQPSNEPSEEGKNGDE